MNLPEAGVSTIADLDWAASAPRRRLPSDHVLTATMQWESEGRSGVTGTGRRARGRGDPRPALSSRTVPPITELVRIEPVHLERLERQGVFTTGLLLEVTETPTRRQYLADQVDASTNDVLTWRDEAQMLNLAGFGSTDHRLLMQAGFEGLRDILAVDLPTFRAAVVRAAGELQLEAPSDLTLQGWWEQAQTLAEA